MKLIYLLIAIGFSLNAQAQNVFSVYPPSIKSDADANPASASDVRVRIRVSENGAGARYLTAQEEALFSVSYSGADANAPTFTKPAGFYFKGTTEGTYSGYSFSGTFKGSPVSIDFDSIVVAGVISKIVAVTPQNFQQKVGTSTVIQVKYSDFYGNIINTTVNPVTMSEASVLGSLGAVSYSSGSKTFTASYTMPTSPGPVLINVVSSGNSAITLQIAGYAVCGANKHEESGACVDDSRSCVVSNGSGLDSWLGNQWSGCIVQNCDGGYLLQSNSCRLITYTAQCAEPINDLLVCDGTIQKPKSLSTCVNDLTGQSVALSSCSASYCSSQLVNVQSPAGSFSESITNGTKTTTCVLGSSVKNFSYACDTGYIVQNGACVQDNPWLAKVTTQAQLQSALANSVVTTIELQNDIAITTSLGNIPATKTIDGKGFSLTGNNSPICNTNSGVIKNLVVKPGVVTGGNGGYLGGICNYNDNLMDNVSLINGQVQSGSTATGGMVGWNRGTIRNCLVQGTRVIAGSNGNTGGVAGFGGGNIQNCEVANMIMSGQNTFYGGIIGYASGGILDNLTVRDSTVGGQYYVGGLVGVLYTNMSNSKVINTSILGTAALGGLVGQNAGQISNSYVKGGSVVSNENRMFNGLAWFQSGTIINSCYDMAQSYPDKYNYAVIDANNNGLYDKIGSDVGQCPLLISGTEEVYTTSSLVVGSMITYAVNNNKLYRWGLGFFGSLMNGSEDDILAPLELPAFNGQAAGLGLKEVSSGQYNSCIIGSDLQGYCVGDNRSRFLDPSVSADGLYSFRSIMRGDLAGKNLLHIEPNQYGEQYCAIDTDNLLYCWGYGNNGMLSDGTNNSSSNPLLMSTGLLAGKQFKKVALGSSHVCALAFDEKIYCWGSQTNGALGDNTSGFLVNSQPVQVIDTNYLGEPVADIASLMGGSNCLITKNTKQVYCWGDNSYGQLGVGNFTRRTIPTKIAGVAQEKFTKLDAGEYFMCGLTESKKLYCWGQGSDGRLGNGSSSNSPSPSLVLAPGGVKSFGVGNIHGCLLNTFDEVHCWGSNWRGRIGVGLGTGTYTSPVKVNPFN